MRKTNDLTVTDLWFRTGLSLQELANRLGLQDADFDYENVYEWIIAPFAGDRIDINRSHRDPEAFTSIFLVGRSPRGEKREIPTPLQETLIEALRSVEVMPVFVGRCWIGRGDKFESELVRKVEG
jgi:hypothetical protein